MRKIVALCVAVGLSGCMSAGVQVKESELAQFQKGKSTFQDVVAKLGPPTTNSLMADGRRIVVYSYTQAQARPESFVPLVGPLIGGADAKSNTATFMFDKAGILETVSASSTGVGVGNGFAAGTGMQDRVANKQSTAE